MTERPAHASRRSGLRAFLRTVNRTVPDGEAEVAMNRVIALVVFFAVKAGLALGGSEDLLGSTGPALLYFAAAIGLVGHMLLRPMHANGRRHLALVFDLAAISWETHRIGEVGAFFYPAYLWVIFGNGFRFGQSALLLATGGSIASFLAVGATTPFWRQHVALTSGLTAGLVVLPLYVHALIARLSRARAAAEAANRAKSLFLASVSHDLRTPLNAIMGMSHLLHRSSLDDAQAEMATTISLSAETLLKMISELLDLSRIDAGRMPLVEADFDLVVTLGKLRRILAVPTREKGLALGLHVSLRTPHLVHGDETRLLHILYNLCSNAIRFTETGGLSIAVDGVEDAGGQVLLRIEVTDTGIGIALEAQTRIFQAFTQADATIRTKFGGSGLGLAITERSVRLLGGTIGLSSTLGAGSRFWCEIILPTRRDVEYPPSVHSAGIVTLDPNARDSDACRVDRSHGLRARVIAENAELRADIIAALAGAGIEASSAGDVFARSALAQIACAADTAAILEFGPGILVEVAPPRGDGLPDDPCRMSFLTTLSPPFLPADMARLVELVRKEGAGHARATDDARSDVASPPVRRLRILVADDNATNRTVIARILEQAGHAVTVRVDGEEALDALGARDFDAAVIDVNMPVMSGIDAVRIHRFETIGDDRPPLPIIGLTADASAQTHADCLAAGMQECLTKPIDPMSLIALLERLTSGLATQAGIADGSPGAAPGEPVVPITAHARFRDRAGALDPEILSRLHAIGGPGFVDGLVADYVIDAQDSLASMQGAMRDGDVTAYRNAAHGLRSGALNIGARELARLLKVGETITARALATTARGELRRIEAELRHVSRHVASDTKQGRTKDATP